MDRAEWLKKLQNKSDVQVFDTPQKKQLDKEIREHIRNGGSVREVAGIYGDFIGAGAYVKGEIQTESGIKTEFYGCSYRWNGVIWAELIDSAATTKRVLMEDIIFLSKFKFLSFFLLFKNIREALIYRFLRIYAADLQKFLIDPTQDLQRDHRKKQLNIRDLKEGSRELIRAGKKYFGKLIYCLVLFFEADNAYWQRFQDIVGNLDKERLRINVRREILRILDIGIERENEMVIDKVKTIRKLISIILFVPSVKKLARDFLLELDLSKIRQKEADYYFSLNRRGYNFNGISFEKRLSEWERINKDRGHIILGI